ncbi:alpha/beta-hydrolase [Xylaria intraflava]|nr:alpha/beta-hydrolase [Xylaria intraflava]
MPPKKPILVFCPGAWCAPEYFQLTTAILTKTGYTCLTVSLPSVGSELRPKDAPPIALGLQADASAVRAVVIPHLDAGNDVVLVCHSYGGVVSSEAVRGLDRASRGADTGAVIHLVYVAAILLDVGAQVWPGGNPRSGDKPITAGELCWRDPSAPGAERWLAGCNEAQMQLVASSVRSHAWRCFSDPVTHAGWRYIPGTYAVAKKDLMRNMIAAAPAGHRFEDVVEVDGDHFAFCSAAEQVADVIRKAAEKAVGPGI